MDGPELAQARGNPDETLLDEIDRVAKQVEREEHEQDRDDEGHDPGAEVAIHVAVSGQPDVARMELVADLIETERALSDEPAVDAGGQRRLTMAAETLAQERT